MREERSESPNPEIEIRNRKFENLKFETPNPKLESRNSKTETQKSKMGRKA